VHRCTVAPGRSPFPFATRSPFRRAAALCAALLSLSVAAGRAQVTHCLPADPVWSWVNPLPHGQALTQVRWVPERSDFVAVGDAVMAATDGVGWTRLHGFAPNMVRDFWWNGTTAVAVGENPSGFFGVLYVSTDFTTWTPGGFVDSTPPSIFLRNVFWNGSAAVTLAIGSTGVFRSADGLTWETIGNGGPA